jgi:hypothetical protein
VRAFTLRIDPHENARFEIASVLVRLDHVARCIVNAKKQAFLLG